MIWLGSALAVVCGAILLVAFALALHGRRALVVDWIVGFVQLSLAGLVGLVQYHATLKRFAPKTTSALVVSVLLPAAAVLLFATLFVLANPDVTQLARQLGERISRALAAWANELAEDAPRYVFWVFAAYLAIGLLRPLVRRSAQNSDVSMPLAAEPIGRPQHAPLFASIRNMLVAVIGLFAVYLIFEFSTLWFRTFPVGFYYAGYAHEGAAWLTAALALATLILSLIFRGRVLADPRLAQLRLLAWIWSAQNLLLALAVYHRMYIYIDFNGMTRMRMIGLFGISAVVVGFLLVLWKIVKNRGFAWLVERQLLALAAAIYVFALTPVDTIVHSYNVRQILAGDLAPAVQISVHPNSAEGFLVLEPLVDCSDPIIRDGIRALLAQQELDVERRVAESRRLGWTSLQAADEMLLVRLRENRSRWSEYRSDTKRNAALQQFHRYAYQWY